MPQAVTERTIAFLLDLREVLLKHEVWIESRADAADDTGLTSELAFTVQKKNSKRCWDRYELLTMDDVSVGEIDDQIKLLGGTVDE